MVLSEALRQVAEGDDFWSAQDLTASLSPEQACRVPEGAPYSIGTQVAHALFWQNRWLKRLRGEEPPRDYTDAEDFPVVTKEEWPRIRDQFLAGIREARKFADGADDDPQRAKWLLQIVIHNSYHIGQIALLRRLSGLPDDPRA